MTEPAVLTIGDICSLLKISEATARRLDARRAIPGRVTIGRAVRFLSEPVQQWIAAGLRHEPEQKERAKPLKIAQAAT